MMGRPRREGRPGRERDAAAGPQWWRRWPVVLGLGAVAVAAALLVVWSLGGDPVTVLDDAEVPPAVTVPDVVGLPLAEAVAEVVSAGLGAATEVVETAGGTAAGTIVAQDPPAGVELGAGSQVLLGVARSNLVVVPDVVGLQADDAAAALAGAGLAPATGRVPANGQAPGTVVGQEPGPGTQVAAGSRVRLDVAGDGGREAAGDGGGAAAGDAGNGERRNVIAWILDLGPSAPSGPSQFRAYQLLRDGECAELVRQLDGRGDAAINLRPPSDGLYRGAAAACLAAFHGQQDRWSEAVAALGVVDPADPGVGCLDAAAHLLLERLVSAHRDNPGGRFERATGDSSAQAPPCPALSRLDPDSGPPDAVVRVDGTNLDRVTSVRLVTGGGACPPGPDVRGESLDFAQEGGDLVVTLDDALPAPACMVLSAAPDRWAADGARFTVVEEPAEGSGEGEGRSEGEGEGEGEGSGEGRGEGVGEGEGSGDGEGEGEKPREQSSAPEEPATPGTGAADDQPGS